MSMHPIEEFAQIQRASGIVFDLDGDMYPIPHVDLDGDLYGETTVLLDENASLRELRLRDIMGMTAEIASCANLSEEDLQELAALEFERHHIEADIELEAERLAFPGDAQAIEVWLAAQLDSYLLSHPGVEIDGQLRFEIDLLADFIGTQIREDHPEKAPEGLMRVAQALYEDLKAQYEEIRLENFTDDSQYLLSESPLISA